MPLDAEVLDPIIVDRFTDDDWCEVVRHFMKNTAGFGFDDPEYLEAVDRLYRQLGITPTNNMYMWFSSKPPLPADDGSDEYMDASMHNFTSIIHDDLPAARALRSLRLRYPGYFELVAELVDQNLEAMKRGLAIIKQGREQSAEDAIADMVLELKMRFAMEKILNLLRTNGMSEDEIRELN